MSAVFEEKFGSSSVQRRSVPAGTRMSWALELVCTPRNNAEKVKYAQIRRMCYLPVRRPGRTLSNRTSRGTKSEIENESCTAGTHPNSFPEISTRGVSGNYSLSRCYFNRQVLRTCEAKTFLADNTSP